MRFPHPHRLLNARLTRLILCVVVLLQFSAATSAGDSADAEKVAKWIADLKSENVRVRLSAAYNYDRLQPIDEETVKHIIAGLTDSNREVRKYCASALGEIDKDPQLVVPALAQTLRDADRDVREHALVALIKIGVPAAPVLIESLKTAEAAPSPTAPAAADDPELWLRRYALLALTEIGIPAVPALMDASVGKDARLASRAAEALSAIKANEELSVASFLDDKDYRLKLWANQSLERDSELLQMLQHGDKRFRVTIIKSLDRLFSAEQITVLTKLLNDPDADVRREVVRALGRAYDDSIAPTLARQYPQETKELKLEILSALSRLTDASPPILDLFTAALTDPESEIRERALDGLLSFNAGARVAPTAVRMLAQRPESRRYYSSYYITDMGAVAIPPLIELLKDPNEDIRLFALRSLTQIDRQEDRKTAAVLALLQDPSRKVQVAAAVSLIGTPHSETALQLLMSLAKDPDIQTRQHVLETVRQLRRKPTVSELFVAQCLQDSTVEVRQLGIALLGSEDILSPRLITLLIEKLSDGDDEVQSRAARLLTNGRKQLTSAQVQEITSKLLAAIRQLNPLGANGYSSYYALLYALKDIGDPAKVDEALLELLNSDNAKVVNLVLADLGQRIPEDPRLTAAIIKLLESPNATIRLETIRTVWRLDGIPWSIFPHLKKLNDPDPGIRREVLGSMWRLRQGVTVSVTEVEPLLQDPDPLVRLEAIRAVFSLNSDSTKYAHRLIHELSALPDQTVTELSEEQQKVQSTIRGMLWNQDPPTMSILLSSLESAKPGVKRDVSAVLAGLSSIPPTALATVIRALKDPDVVVRINAARIIERNGEKAKQAAAGLLGLIEDADERARLNAANALFAIGVDLASAGPVFNAVINDDSIRRALRPPPDPRRFATGDRVAAFISGARSSLGDRAGASYARIVGGSDETYIPDFPWPPPRYADTYVLPSTSIAKDKDTLGYAYDRLRQALADKGYDTGLFRVPGGIALATKVERIYEDGKSYPPPYRWTKGKVAPGSVREWFSALFMERPGQFRMFVFIVTNQSFVGGGKSDLSETSASALARSGAGALPREMGSAPFKGRHCHVVIYRFQKRVGQPATIEHADPIGLSPQVHLRQSGLLGQLGVR